MENVIAPAVQTYKNVTLNPSVSAGLNGTAAFGVGVVVRDDFIAYFLEGVLQAQLAHARGDEVCADLGGFVVFLSVHLSGVFEQNI